MSGQTEGSGAILIQQRNAIKMQLQLIRLHDKTRIDNWNCKWKIVICQNRAFGWTKDAIIDTDQVFVPHSETLSKFYLIRSYFGVELNFLIEASWKFIANLSVIYLLLNSISNWWISLENIILLGSFLLSDSSSHLFLSVNQWPKIAHHVCSLITDFPIKKESPDKNSWQ